MEYLAKARLKNINVSPRKVRLVADCIRNRDVKEALAFLHNTQRRSNAYLIKLINSAIANAIQKKNDVIEDDLIIKYIFVDEGKTLKRFRARAMGRGAPIKKRTSHINIFINSKENNGTKN